VSDTVVLIGLAQGCRHVIAAKLIEPEHDTTGAADSYRRQLTARGLIAARVTPSAAPHVLGCHCTAHEQKGKR
jgi:hypothetical protein